VSPRGSRRHFVGGALSDRPNYSNFTNQRQVINRPEDHCANFGREYVLKRVIDWMNVIRLRKTVRFKKIPQAK